MSEGVESAADLGRFRPYPEYKDSGVDLLGQMPAHWRALRADSFLHYEKDQVDPSGLATDTVFHYSIPSIQETGDGSLESASEIDSAKLKIAGDRLLVSKLNPRKGVVLIGRPQSEATVCSTEFIPLKAVSCELIWAHYLYSAHSAKSRLSAVVQSATRSHQRAKPSDITKMWHGVPPLPEQRAIAEFLDRETGKIDALVAKKERLIELLQEKRTALITHAVTKGLDPTAPTKPSGIPWLGNIPAHWEVKKLGHLGSLQNGLNIGGEAFGSGDPFVSYSDVYGNSTVPNQPAGLVKSTAEDQRKYGLRCGDVLFTRTSETVDDIGVASTCLQEIPRVTFAGFLIRFRPSSTDLNPNYSSFLFRNQGVQDFFSGSMNLVTRASLSQGLLKTLPIGVPPIHEQVRIAEYLEKTDAAFDRLTDNLVRLGDTLAEQRTALISAAVTGKIDVREEAA